MSLKKGKEVKACKNCATSRKFTGVSACMEHPLAAQTTTAQPETWKLSEFEVGFAAGVEAEQNRMREILNQTLKESAEEKVKNIIEYLSPSPDKRV